MLDVLRARGIRAFYDITHGTFLELYNVGPTFRRWSFFLSDVFIDRVETAAEHAASHSTISSKSDHGMQLNVRKTKTTLTQRVFSQSEVSFLAHSLFDFFFFIILQPPVMLHPVVSLSTFKPFHITAVLVPKIYIFHVLHHVNHHL